VKDRIQKLINKVPMRGLLLLLLILALAVGAYFVTGSDDKTRHSNKNSNGSTANLSGKNRQNALDLAKDNAVLTEAALKSQIEGSKDAVSKKQKAYDSAQSLGGAINDLYGSSAQTQFNKFWKTYTDQLFKYADAAKKGDQVAKGVAARSLDADFARPLAAYMAKINPTVNEVTARSALSASSQDMIGIIDAYVTGDNSQVSALEQDNKQFISTVFGFLIDGVQKPPKGTQVPKKFTPSKQ
jgi:hypothetical protein